VIRNIIFDWSGTLVDDLPAVWRATNFVLQKAGLPELTLPQFRQEFVLPFRRFYDRFTPHIALAQLEEWFHSHFRQVQDSVVELPHARDFLQFCRAQGVRTFLLSSVHRDHFAVQTARNGFHEFLSQSYVEVWDKREKIGALLAEHALTPEETLFIGDMQHDIETAQHGGVYSCAVLTGYQSLAQLQASQPDLIVEHLGELRGILVESAMDLVSWTKSSSPTWKCSVT
jgi:phosphoglycolate phosphatase